MVCTLCIERDRLSVAWSRIRGEVDSPGLRGFLGPVTFGDKSTTCLRGLNQVWMGQGQVTQLVKVRLPTG
jgi:hypothetical protein